MSHAIRLNLRMQKELQLLISDPPPGISLLPDSNDGCSTSSLSHVEARIKGPEGTVYEKGMFHVRVQIPERYPFQPPNVTFVTPVYHPNIDNGGRICLDILNLPPKGAWQPSLNISTVLTSIALLLGEPNPDDGLMCETSREYKFDRQKFDLKARSWTEKYATGLIDASKEYNELKGEASSSKPDELLQESEINQRKTCPISEKLRRRSSLYRGIMNHGGKDTNDDNLMRSSCENEEDLGKSLKIVGAIVVSDSEESEKEDVRPAKFRKLKRREN